MEDIEDKDNQQSEDVLEKPWNIFNCSSRISSIILNFNTTTSSSLLEKWININQIKLCKIVGVRRK
ncbi:hypothetical protein LR48_Vigan358s000400 [Vigna angularis]|uniref:Uncharacterized protein n=1 Tax=Phaseolus angularis TaxID=3914 RepID=A0A0L9T9J5_PHAAN|nr:hypothetical protein LR48_Vigan358s000400 [Vigna angularis]